MQTARVLAGVVLVSAATACRQPATTASATPVSIASVAAEPPAAPAVSPNEADPAIAAARRLFPQSFGLPPGRGAVPSKVPDMMLYSSLATRLGEAAPPASCLNLIGQPGLTQAGLDLVVDRHWEEGLFTASPLVFRNRHSGYILAVPDGTEGALWFRLTEQDDLGYPDDRAPDVVAEVSLAEIYVIEPGGRYVKSRAVLEITDKGLVRLCSSDLTRSPSECGPTEAEPAADAMPVPSEFDPRRCDKGCEKWCNGEIYDALDCSAPPPPMCVEQSLRIFLPGVDVGERCLYEEWDVRCAQGCNKGRCDAASPAFGWRVAIGAPTVPAPVLLLPDTLALIVNDGELVTVSSQGRILHRDRLTSSSVLYLASDQNGVAYTLDALGTLAATRDKRLWQVAIAKTLKASQQAGLTVSRGTLYAAHTSKLWAFDTANGNGRWTVDLNGDAAGPPLVMHSNQIVQASERELVLIDAAGTVRARSALGSKLVSLPLLTASGEVLLATEDRTLWLGPVGNLRRLTTLTEAPTRWLTGMADAALLITREMRGKPPETRYTLRRLALPSGRESWRHELDDISRPVVDSRGRIVISTGSDVIGLSMKDETEWTLDLRGRHIWRAVAAPDGAVYLQDDGGVSRWTLPMIR